MLLIRTRTSKEQKGYTHAMNRIPPSQKIGKKFKQMMSQGLDGEDDVTSMVVRLGIERVVQEMVEQEVADYLERDHYQRRRPEQEHRGYRNGYKPGLIRTAEGEIVVRVPEVCDAPETYRSPLVGASWTNAPTDGGSRVAAWLFQINRPRTPTAERANTLTRKMSQFLDLYVVPFIFDASFCRKVWQTACICKDVLYCANVPKR